MPSRSPVPRKRWDERVPALPLPGKQRLRAGRIAAQALVGESTRTGRAHAVRCCAGRTNCESRMNGTAAEKRALHERNGFGVRPLTQDGRVASDPAATVWTAFAPGGVSYLCMDAMGARGSLEALLAERAWLRRLAASLVHDACLADDLTQDTLVAAIERAPARVSRPRAWLATVLRNLTRNRARDERRRRLRDLASEVRAAPPSPAETLARAELVERVGRAVLDLPEPYRSTTLMRFFEDEPPRRIAARMGVPVETVRTRLKRALATLARYLDEGSGGRRAWAGGLLGWVGSQGGAGAVGTIAGGIAMKKVLAVAAVALLFLGVGWVALVALRGGGADEAGGAPPPLGSAGEARTDEDATAPTLVGSRPAAPAGRDVPRGTASVRGVVIDEAGRPAPGVPVRVALPPHRLMVSLEKAPALDAELAPATALGETVSDAEGAFRVEGLPYGTSLEVAARPASPRHGSRTVVTRQPWTDAGVVLVVGEGTTLRGRVVDAAGRGVPAWVEGHQRTVRGSNRALNTAGRWTAAPVSTAADGRFRFPHVPSGGVELFVVVPGRAAHWGIPVATPASGEVEVRFEGAGGATVAGRVRDARGAPIAGAAVVVQSLRRPYGTRYETTHGRSVTDAEGRYRVEGLMAGQVQEVTVTAGGYGPPQGLLGHQTPLPAGATTTIDVTLVRAVSVAGTVTDEGGRPLAGAQVRAVPVWPPGDTRGYALRWDAETDAKGAFRVEGLPFLPVSITATLDGYVAEPNPPPDPMEPLRPTEEGQALEALVVLRKDASTPGAIAGSAVRGDGNPAPGAVVTAVAAVEGAPWGTPQVVRSAECAADGSFRLEDLAASATWRLCANAPGWASEPASAVPGAAPLRLVLRPVLILRGKVLGPEGRPVPDVRVRSTVEGGTPVEAATAIDGTFEFPGIAAGTHSLEALDARGSRGGDPVTVTVAEGGSPAPVVLRVPALHRLGGILVDPKGRPLPGRQVRLGAWSEPGPCVYADDDGRFEFTLLAAGEHAICVNATPAAGTYATGPTDHRVVWSDAPRRVVEVVLLDPRGVAIETAMVWFRTGRDLEGQRTSGSGARASAGKFRAELQAEDADFDLEVVTATDASGRRLNVLPATFRDLDPASSPFTFRLEEGRTVQGRVVDAEGKGVGGVTVFVGPLPVFGEWWRATGSGGDAHDVRTADDGTFTAVGLAAEGVVAAVRPAPGWLETPPVEVRPGTGEIVLRLERGAALRGRVIDDAGRPVANAQVHAALTQAAAEAARRGLAPSYVDRGWTAIADPQGRFTIEGLPPSQRLDLDVSGAAPLLRGGAKEVVAGTEDLVIRLETGTYVEGEWTGEGWDETPMKVALAAAGEDGNLGSSAAWQPLDAGIRRFRLGPVAAGPWTLCVTPDTGFEPLVRVEGVRAPASGLRVALPRSRNVVGRLVGGDLARFEISVRIGDRRTGTAVDASGRFRIANAADEPVTVYAFRDGDARFGLVEGVRPSKDPILVRLEPGREISGRVEGVPKIARMEVTVRNDRGQRKGTGDPSSGSFRVVGLPPGAYDLEVWLSFDPPTPGRVLSSKSVSAGTTNLSLR